MANKYQADVNAEGPLWAFRSAHELLTYYHLQLMLVEGLLRGRFSSPQADCTLDQVEQLQKYGLKLKDAEVPEDLIKVFTHEMALLLFTRLLLLRKMRKLVKNANTTDTLKCTCV